MSDQPAPEECAVCGADIPPKAKACPECGADERTGWREQSIYDGIELPEEEFVAPKSRRMSAPTFWKVTCILLVVLFVVMVWREL
jgi:hypothetical protein